MHHLLQHDKENIVSLLNSTVHMAHEYLSNQDTLAPSLAVKNIDPEILPGEGLGALNTLNYFKQHYAGKMANTAGPRYFGFVTGGSTPAALVGDWLVSAYDQNACGSNDSIAPQLEHQTIDFFKQLLGLNQDYFGSFVTGATVSNFVGLALGRQWIGEKHGIDFSEDGIISYVPLKILSATPHSSVTKSLSMLGIGRKALHRMDTLPGREAIDVLELENYLKEHKQPVIVVANAGTVNTVDFDDLKTIGKLKSTYNFWLHIDAAFGGFAACSEKYAHLMEGINYADSITVDAHKWLNVPYDAAMQFTKHKNLQLKVFQNSAAYLGDPSQSPDFFHYTPENSRRFRALPSWFTFKAYGKAGIREIVERNCEAAHVLGEKINSSDSFTLLAPVRMNVVCFTLREDTITVELIRQFLNSVRDDGQVFFTPTVYQGIPAIRAAISNWQTERADVELAFTVLEGIRRGIPKSTSAEAVINE